MFLHIKPNGWQKTSHEKVRKSDPPSIPSPEAFFTQIPFGVRLEMSRPCCSHISLFVSSEKVAGQKHRFCTAARTLAEKHQAIALVAWEQQQWWSVVLSVSVVVGLRLGSWVFSHSSCHRTSHTEQISRTSGKGNESGFQIFPGSLHRTPCYFSHLQQKMSIHRST